MSILTKKELSRLGTIPHDLKTAINCFECIQELFEEMECNFFKSGQIPDLISHSYLNESDKMNQVTISNISAINQVMEYITFVIEASDGNLVGYWHGPENIEIQKSPVVMYTTEGQFNILQGANLIEALVGDYLFDDNEEFLEFQSAFAECGINIVSKWDDLAENKPKTHPSELHEKLFDSLQNNY